tara:strand:- start:7 stop:279 length:273 start_codon:yes stop_codon:yes gene_type:complete
MEYVSVHVKVPKEASELIEASLQLLAAIKQAGSKGLGVDSLTDLSSAVMKVVSEASDYEKIREEILKDQESAANLAAITGAKILKALDLI